MKRYRFYFFSLSAILAFLPAYVMAGSATLNWQPNQESDLAGYRVYHGTESRTYGPPLSVNTGTTCSFNDLTEGRTYYFAVTAIDTSGNESGFSNEVQKAIKDGTSPVVSLLTPTTATSYTATTSTLRVTGEATGNDKITQVVWENSLGGSGTAKGTSSWRVSGIALAEGVNTLTFTARDAAGNLGSRSLAVTYNLPETAAADTVAPSAADTVAPSVRIVSPTTKTNYFSGETIVDLAGTASDNDRVETVIWKSSSDESGTVEKSGTAAIRTQDGTQEWAVTGIPLSGWSTYITVTATDPAGNNNTATLKVYCRSLK
ncbi:MAG: fibronectin type III domain-containing protein [Desulfobacteraceae bacterium]|jgi:hypothetical protein|nr:fibronectin type III domain-containing protein [Desulfobacteraceae bacterium]